MTQNAPDLKLPADLAVAVLRYLEARPLNEVVGMWNALRQLRPVDDGHAAAMDGPGSMRGDVPPPDTSAHYAG